MTTRKMVLFALLFGAAVAWACQAPITASDGDADSDSDADVEPGHENTWDACRDGLDNDGDGFTDCNDTECAVFPECSHTDGDADADADEEECEAISAEANNSLRPVDIIWAVDSSDSMANDARAVQTNLTGFTEFIAAAGIDFHLILISDHDFVTPSPLFTTDPEHFLFVNRHISSSSVFARLLDQHGSYEHFLRPTAITHIVGVTDDDDDMNYATFISSMTDLLGHDFTFHAVAATEGMFGLPCVRGVIPAADVGEEYFDAADATGGHRFSICTSDWSALFGTLAETVAVTEELPCVFELPEPPEGMVFDRTRVNVQHTPEGGAPTLFPYAGSEVGCGMEPAWYYDNEADPTQIILCPAACTTVTSGPGRVDIQLGCETVLI